MSDKPVPRGTGSPPLIPSPRAAVLALAARPRGLRLLLLAAAVAMAFSLGVPAFATQANVVTMLADASIIGIAAIGLFLVVLSGGVDLSIGAVAGLAPLLGSLWGGQPAAPLLFALALAAGGGIGLAAGGLIVGGGLAAFAVTLGVDALVRGAGATLASGPGRIGASTAFLPDLDATMGLPASIALLAIVAALAAAFLYGLRGGRVLAAIGSDRRAATEAGLDTLRYGIGPYAVSGMLAAVAGLLSATAAPSSLAITEFGCTLTLDTLTAVVIGGASLRGGRGSLGGVLLGVATVVMIRSGLWLMDVAALWQSGAIGGLLLVGLALDRWADPREGH